VKKGIGEFIASGLAAPALGLFSAWYGLDRIARANEVPVSQLGQYCKALDQYQFGPGCNSVELLNLLQQLSLIALAATIALPLIYWVCAQLLARNGDALARYFPPLVRVVIGLLALLLVAHGALVWWATWQLIEEDVMPRNLYLLAIPFFLGAGLLLAGLSILADMGRLLATESLGVTGVVVEPSDYPELHARVARLAAKLNSRPPERIIVGIEPTAFVAAMPIRLRGVAELESAETLYLPCVALRVLDDAELDALIGHELGHFRGADLEFSSRFAPAFKTLEQAVESVSIDDGNDDENPWMGVARLPAIGLLTLMSYILAKAASRLLREREFAADRASLEVSNPGAVVSLLIKVATLSLQWQEFRRGLNSLLDRGFGRRNISLDYLERTRQFLAATSPGDIRAQLIDMAIPHPLDLHPTIAARAAAVGVAPEPLIGPALARLAENRPVPAILTKIEEQVTQIDLDYVRVPGHPIKLPEDDSLPPELALPAPQTG